MHRPALGWTRLCSSMLSLQHSVCPQRLEPVVTGQVVAGLLGSMLTPASACCAAGASVVSLSAEALKLYDELDELEAGWNMLRAS